MKTELIIASNRAVLAYVSEIKEVTGLSTYKVLKQAEISLTLVTNIKNGYRKSSSILSLGLVLQLYKTHKVPFNTANFADLFNN